MPSHRMLLAASLLILFTPTLGFAQNKCVSAKIKAAVKKFTCSAGLEAKRLTTGQPIDVTKVAKCTSSYSKTFAKIEAKAKIKGGCRTLGDGDDAAATVDAFVADLAGDFFCASQCPNGKTHSFDCSCICTDFCPDLATQNPDCSCTCLDICPDGVAQNPDCSCDCPNTCQNGATQNPDCSCACPNTCLNGGTLNPDCTCICPAGYESLHGGCFRISNTGPGDDCFGGSCEDWSGNVDGSGNFLCVVVDFSSGCSITSDCPLGSACHVNSGSCLAQCTAP